jgi:CheY-like chemotaxis protein
MQPDYNSPLIHILVVEDNPGRVGLFREWFAHSRVRFLHVRCGDTALQCIRTGRFELMLLDHDLVEGHPMGTEGRVDGRGVTRAIVEAPQHRRTPLIIHSMNPGGRNQMYQILVSNKLNVAIKPFDTWSAPYARDRLQDLLRAEQPSVTWRGDSAS